MSWFEIFLLRPHLQLINSFYHFSFQFDNIANRRAHFETTGPEIWNQTDGRIDAVTFSTGTGGTLAGKETPLNLPLLSTCCHSWPAFVLMLFQKISQHLPWKVFGTLGLLRSPTPLEFLMTFHWKGMDYGYFLELHSVK